MQEMMIDDGIQINPEQLTVQPEQMPEMVLTSDFSNFYTEEEFYQQFKSIFQYATDRTGIKSIAIKESEERGARITANRIYEQAQKYEFLRFLIDKTTSRLAETILMIQFLAFKSSDIYAEKTKRKLGGDLWQKIKKITKRFRQTQMGNELAYSGQAVAEKQPKQEV